MTGKIPFLLQILVFNGAETYQICFVLWNITPIFWQMKICITVLFHPSEKPKLCSKINETFYLFFFPRKYFLWDYILIIRTIKADAKEHLGFMKVPRFLSYCKIALPAIHLFGFKKMFFSQLNRIQNINVRIINLFSFHYTPESIRLLIRVL